MVACTVLLQDGRAFQVVVVRHMILIETMEFVQWVHGVLGRVEMLVLECNDGKQPTAFV